MKFDVQVQLDERKDCWGFHKIAGVTVDGAKGERLYGGCRCTFRVGDKVIKIDEGSSSSHKDRPSYLQSRDTPRMYRSLDPEDRELVPKLLGHGKLEDGRAWIIEEYREDLDESLSGSPELRDRVRDFSYKYNCTDIITGCNWGISKVTGKPIIFDYVF